VSILTGRFQCRVLTGLGAIFHFIGVIMTGFAPSLGFLYFSYGTIVGEPYFIVNEHCWFPPLCIAENHGTVLEYVINVEYHYKRRTILDG